MSVAFPFNPRRDKSEDVVPEGRSKCPQIMSLIPGQPNQEWTPADLSYSKLVSLPLWVRTDPGLGDLHSDQWSMGQYETVYAGTPVVS